MSDNSSSIGNLVRALNRLSLAIEESGRQGTEEWEVITEVPEEPAEPNVPVGDHYTAAEQLPPCPPHLLRLGRRLVAGEYSVEYRIKRAWEAGYWASLVLARRLRRPRASLPLSLRSCIFVILRAPGLSSPTRVSSVSDLYRITGRFSEETVCHGFPSIAEPETYCEAAGVEFPCQHQWT